MSVVVRRGLGGKETVLSRSTFQRSGTQNVERVSSKHGSRGSLAERARAKDVIRGGHDARYENLLTSRPVQNQVSNRIPIRVVHVNRGRIGGSGGLRGIRPLKVVVFDTLPLCRHRAWTMSSSYAFKRK